MNSELLSLFACCVALYSVRYLYVYLKAGYYTATLPLVCVVMYTILTIEWMLTGQRYAVGDIRDTVWSLVEIGIMVGYLHLLKKVHEGYVEVLKNAVETRKENINNV